MAIARRTLPLHRLHREWGARFVTHDGLEVPAAYGAVDAEYAALCDGWALIDRSDVARLELMGEDRQRFLNGLVTCDVKALVAGQGAYGYFTDRQGKILADVVVLALADRLWLELPAAAGETIRGHLEKYIIADRVELKPLDDLVLWTVAGPAAGERLASLADGPLPPIRLGGQPAALWSHAKRALAGSEVQIARQGRLGVDAWTLWASASLGRSLAETLREQGALPVGREALDVVRVEQGIGRFGQDFGTKNFPQEVGEESAVSYTKGCYLGQEIVARIHYRGGVHHRLTPLAFDGAEPPPPGTALLYEDREVGTVTSVAVSPRQRAIGLALLHERGWAAAAFGGAVAARPRLRGQ